jgi:hypothetical protein
MLIACMVGAAKAIGDVMTIAAAPDAKRRNSRLLELWLGWIGMDMFLLQAE